MTKLFRHLTGQSAPPIVAVSSSSKHLRMASFLAHHPTHTFFLGVGRRPLWCVVVWVCLVSPTLGTMDTGVRVRRGHAFVIASSLESIYDLRSAGQVRDGRTVHTLCPQWRSEGSLNTFTSWLVDH
jgi:carbon starvation protein CstA